MLRKRRALTEQIRRALHGEAYVENDFERYRALLAEGDPGGGAAPAAAPAAAAEPAAPAAEPIVAAEPATPAAVIEPVKPAEPAKPSADDMRKYLTEKGGKAEDLAKLADADLEKQFTEAKAQEGKPAEVKAEDIQIKMPKGVEVDEKLMSEFKAIVADPKLAPQDRAQKLVDMHVSALKAAAEGPYKLWTDTQTKWQGEVKADAEIGGTNFDAMRSTISKAITDVGGAEAGKIFEAFRFTGAANNPDVVRLMYRMSKLVVEGGPVVGGAPAAGKGKGTAAAIAAMYPSANNGEAKA